MRNLDLAKNGASPETVSRYFVGYSLQAITMKPIDKAKNIYILAPVLGTVIFVVLYIVATILYPGGSQVDKTSIGFSWTNNYWCNLLNENAINGQYNTAKPIAMTGMFVLCITLSFFWFLFPRHINFGKIGKLVIQISGTLSMTIAYFLFTNINHDLITNLAATFGLVAMVGTFVGLYKSKWLGLFAFGILNMLLIGLNIMFITTQNLLSICQ